MSKMKYKIEVYNSGSTQVRVSSEVERMAPGILSTSPNEWNTEKWDENFRSTKLIQAIGEQKKLGFVTTMNLTNQYWSKRFNNQDQIDMVMIKVIGDGFSKKVHLYDAKVIPLSQVPVYMGNMICHGYTLQFNNSDVDSNWNLNN